MPHRTASQAEDAFIGDIRSAIGCITKKQIILAGARSYGPGNLRAFSFAKGESARLKGKHPVLLEITQEFEILPDDDEGWRVETHKYIYTFYLGTVNRNGQLVSFQWHPRGVSRVHWGHVHLESSAEVGCTFLAEAHLPTNRISVEDLVELAISEFGVIPLSVDWKDIIKLTKHRFESQLRWLVAHEVL